MPELLFDRAARFSDRLAIRDPGGEHRYARLDAVSAGVAGRLLEVTAAQGDLREQRIGYLVEPGFDHVAIQWGIWRAGGIAVPICLSHPAPEIDYLLSDARPVQLIASAGTLIDRIRPLADSRGIPVLTTAEVIAPFPSRPLPGLDAERRALMVYTSGTTGKPKGVVTTHGNIRASVDTLASAWAWRPTDRSLHVLPLHHIHGIINALCCALWSGAAVEFLNPFDPEAAWERLASGEITFFTAVPTIYGRLIAAWDAAPPATRTRWSAGARQLRLMLSGSAALPVGTLARWEELTGHRLLERYGMTEIGMAIANPLEGERRAGTVGQPLPDMLVRLVDERGHPVTPGTPGQIEVRGPQLFREYWDRPEETTRSFRDGWFMTGDVAALENGYYRILGRQSVDIIKSAGYKISALEIEETLREHPAVADCAVVGLPDPDLGERIAAAIVPSDPTGAEPEALRAWLKERLAPYKVPRVIERVTELPRNTMGKVTKTDVRNLFSLPPDASPD